MVVEIRHEGDSLWVRIIKEKYGQGHNEWEAKGSNKMYGVSLWKGIFKVEESFKKGISYSVVNGEKVKIWLDSWASDVPFKTKFADMFNIAQMQDGFISQVAAFDDLGQFHWNLYFKRRLYQHEIDSLVVLLRCLDNFQFAEGEEDSRRWIWNDGKPFTVKSCYEGLAASQGEDIQCNKLWSNKIPQRVNFFIWQVFKARSNKIPQRVNFFIWQVFKARSNKIPQSTPALLHILRGLVRFPY